MSNFKSGNLDCRRVDKEFQDLRQLFQERRASPYDVNVDGNTLLHVACQNLNLRCVRTVNRSGMNRGNLPLIDILIRLFDLGVLPNETDSYGRTALDKFVEQGLTLAMQNMLSVSNGQKCHLSVHAERQMFTRHLNGIPDIAIATQHYDIMLAVMKRSESDLRQAIAVAPHKINDHDTCGWTALHVAVRWPPGVRILVEAGADVDCVRTFDGKSLLDIAIEIMSVELLRILAEADCSFVKESDNHQWYYLGKIQTYKRRTSLPPHSDELNAARTTVAELLVGFIANRRHRLCDLAFEEVPRSALIHFLPTKTDKPYLIDEKASSLALELTSRGITVPPPLNPGKEGETGYHAIRGRPEIAEILWKAGFRDVNGRDSCGMTPLMCCPIENLMKFITWCLGKGFELNLDVEQDQAWYGEGADKFDELRPGQPLETKTIYCKMYQLGGMVEYHRSSQTSLVDTLVSSETDQRIAQKIFMAARTDGCKCACSIGGCTTRTFLFKGFYNLRGRSPSRFYNSLDATEYMRLITFEKLELTHTCCRPHWYVHDEKSHKCIGGQQRQSVRFSRPMLPSEIEEIRDEESADLQKLAELLAEFEAKVIELDIPIPDFLEQYWEPRMEQVLRENEGSLDMKALREIGVEIHPCAKLADL